MADISMVHIGETTYDIKDAVARTAIGNMNSFEYVVCIGAADTPYGVKNGNTTGTLAASASTLHRIYLVPSPSGEPGEFISYVTTGTSGSYTWANIGSAGSGVEIVRFT